MSALRRRGQWRRWMAPNGAQRVSQRAFWGWRRYRRALRRLSTKSPPVRKVSKVEETSGIASVFKLGEYALRGTSQIVFVNSPISGAVMVSALSAVDPLLGVLTFTGAASSTATAKALDFDQKAISSGCLGYNGALVGAIFAVFLVPNANLSLPTAFLATACGAAASTALYIPLSRVMTTIPQWTFSFNAVAMSTLAIVKPLSKSTENVIETTASTVAPIADAIVPVSVAFSESEWLLSPLTGVGQIIVHGEPWGGAAVLAAICFGGALSKTKEQSRTKAFVENGLIPACGAVVGSTVGCLTAYFVLGASSESIVAGLHGFNPALASLAVSTFFRPSISTAVLAVSSAGATTVLAAGLNSALSVVGIPAFSLPFCLVAVATMALASPTVKAFKLR